MTAARLADDEISEWLYACACTLWMVGLASVLRRMVRRFAPGPTERVQAAVSASSAKESLQQRSRFDRFIGYTRAFMYLLLWFVTLAIVGGAPTFVYVLTYNLPYKNVLELKSWKVYALEYMLALYLSVVSGLLIPFVTKPTARAILEHVWNQKDFDEDALKAKQHELASVLGIIARTTVVIVLPVVSVILLANGKHS